MGITVERAAQENLGKAFEYARAMVRGGYQQFFDDLCATDLGVRLSDHDEELLVGAALNLLIQLYGMGSIPSSFETPVRTGKNTGISKEAWLGQVCARYQWASGESFAMMHEKEYFKHLVLIYHDFGKLSVEQAVEELLALYRKPGETSLAAFRHSAQLSQKELARVAHVGIRAIQQYEQRQKSINRAQAVTVYKLARALGATVEDLLEKEEL